MVSAQFIALWLVLLGAASAQWPGNRLKPGLMFAYTFEEGQLGGNPTSTADKTGQNLLGPLTMLPANGGTFSTSSIGLSVNGGQLQDGAISPQDITALLAKLPAGRDFSVEMWLKVNAISGANAVGSLFSITTANVNAQAPDGICTNTLLNIDQGNGQIFGRVSTSGLCSTPSAAITAEWPMPMHLVFSRQGDDVFIHINKNQKGSGSGLATFDYSGWPTGATLKLTHKFTNTWKGTIYAIAMYNQSIVSNIATNFDAWLPNSKPICPDWSAPWTIATDEDVLGLITLNATDLDVDTKRMWGANPPAAFASIGPVTYQITALPTRGSLYKDAAGTLPIRSNDLPYSVTVPNRVWFRALPDEFSVGNTPYTTFQFQAFDGTMFSSICNVPVHVAAVPDAPIAFNDFTSADAQRHTRINLTATCADGPFTIANYSIVTPLPAGDLFFVNNDGSIGSQIMAPATLPVHARFNQVYYRPLAGSTSGQLLQQRVMINFRATSTAGRISNQANVTVQVLNELQALTKTDEGDEDTDIDIFLEQSDFPNNLPTTSFEIRSLPAKGNLYTAGGADIIVGSVIAASASAPHNARIVYKPPADAFGDNYASFTYQAVRQSGSWKSGLGTLVIRVIAVNDAPVIHYPAEITVGFLEEAFININITDVDDRGQLYTLKLHSSLATFTLNQQARSLIPGAQVNPGVSEGFFIGDGDSDQDCTFWTYLPKMNMTMAPFTVLGSSNPAEGTLTLTVQDLDTATKGGSKEAQVDIRVKIIGSGRGGGGGGGAFPEWVQYLVWSGASAVGLGCCGCLFYKQVYVRIKKRSATSTAATYAVSL